MRFSSFQSEDHSITIYSMRAPLRSSKCNLLASALTHVVKTHQHQSAFGPAGGSVVLQQCQEEAL